MRQLDERELDRVNGGFIGTALIAGVNAGNAFFNAVAPIGLALNQLGPGVAAAHQRVDASIYAAYKATAALGYALGGVGTVNYHYTSEWG